MNEHTSRKTGEILPLKSGHVLLLLAALLILISFGGSPYREMMRYQRDAVLAGEVWRMLSASFVHLNRSHTLMNVAALVIIWGLFGGRFANRAWAVITLSCAFGVSLGVLLFDPEISGYVGLSGILHGLLTATAMADWRTSRRTALVVLSLVSGKLLWEQLLGPLPGSTETAGGTIVVDAHLYGAVTGLVCGWLAVRYRL